MNRIERRVRYHLAPEGRGAYWGLEEWLGLKETEKEKDWGRVGTVGAPPQSSVELIML